MINEKKMWKLPRTDHISETSTKIEDVELMADCLLIEGTAFSALRNNAAGESDTIHMKASSRNRLTVWTL